MWGKDTIILDGCGWRWNATLDDEYPHLLLEKGREKYALKSTETRYDLQIGYLHYIIALT